MRIENPHPAHGAIERVVLNEIGPHTMLSVFYADGADAVFRAGRDSSMLMECRINGNFGRADGPARVNTTVDGFSAAWHNGDGVSQRNDGPAQVDGNGWMFWRCTALKVFFMVDGINE